MKFKVIRLVHFIILAVFVYGCGQKKTEMEMAPEEDGSDWIELFNGKDFTGWKNNEDSASFKIVDGILIASGERSHLFYEGEALGEGFDHFELIAEVRTTPGSNSGIFFHTKYQDEGWPAQGFEVQVNLSHTGEGDYRELKKSGSLYNVRNAYFPLAKDGEWYETRIVVNGDFAEVWVNDVQSVSYLQLFDPNRKQSFGKGTFAIQCHDPNSKVEYKSIKVRRLALDPKMIKIRPLGPWHERMMKFATEGHFGFADLNPKYIDQEDIEDRISNGFVTGINVGFIPNEADKALAADLYKTKPIVLGQSVDVPTESASNTYTIASAGDAQIIEKLNNKKVNILSLQDSVPESKLLVLLDAAGKNGVAIEIDNVRKTPSIKTIKSAKAKGCKFSFSGISSLEEVEASQYFLDVIDQAGLGYKDFYFPERATK
ncbi:MAG TPA: DUF1080 domain-containing protein [Saprospiraceae bacterium]|nr:DUF1080 domain-containing protein [Saprospiraceae bacterium]HPN70777.1 DUF1080 domain-containing protein [Saprospiraceae bacterium]